MDIKNKRQFFSGQFVHILTSMIWQTHPWRLLTVILSQWTNWNQQNLRSACSKYNFSSPLEHQQNSHITHIMLTGCLSALYSWLIQSWQPSWVLMSIHEAFQNAFINNKCAFKSPSVSVLFTGFPGHKKSVKTESSEQGMLVDPVQGQIVTGLGSF